MKQAALIRRKQWDVLFVLNTCDYEQFAEIVRGGKLLRGKLVQSWNRWQWPERWQDRNWMQFIDGRNKDVVFISAQGLFWQPNLARFLSHFHDAIPSWKACRKDKNVAAMKDAEKAIRQYPYKRIFVLLKGGSELLPLLSEFINKYGWELTIAVTAIGNQADLIVPWLWAVPSAPLFDDDVLEFPEPKQFDVHTGVVGAVVECPPLELADETKDEIDGAVAEQQYLAQEHPELSEEDADRVDR